MPLSLLPRSFLAKVSASSITSSWSLSTFCAGRGSSFLFSAICSISSSSSAKRLLSFVFFFGDCSTFFSSTTASSSASSYSKSLSSNEDFLPACATFFSSFLGESAGLFFISWVLFSFLGGIYLVSSYYFRFCESGC